jgi:hypothetical protein
MLAALLLPEAWAPFVVLVAVLAVVLRRLLLEYVVC